MWQPINVTGGVVRSREASALEAGEFVTASNCRLKPGDTVQVHNDVGAESFGTPVNTVVAGPFYLSFEGSADKLLCVTTDGASSYLETATVGATGSWASIQTITGVVTAAWVIHRGDQYFVGTDQGNYVVQDNVARVMGMDVSMDNTGQPYIAATDGAFGEGDVVLYTITEYDSTNDLEAQGRQLQPGYSGIGIRFDFSTTSANLNDYPKITWSAAAKVNANADKIRIYRYYLGSEGDASKAEANQVELGQRVFIGGLVDEVDITDEEYIDTTQTKYNPPIQYPVIQTDAIYGGALYYFLQKPANFTMGVLFNDSLVVNDPATSKQVIRYSPPGYPEYQPSPYFMYFATERSDEIVGLRVINNRLVVLTTGAVHRVNYLPFAGDIRAEQGRVQEKITSRAGCVGRWAHTKVETEQGEFVVWLSKRGLEMSDGVGWGDACPDFVGSLVTGSSPVLVNNESLYRLELYDGTTRWDFYYHPSHLKGGRFKLMGPSTVPVSVAKGACANEDYVWVAGSSSVYTVNVGTSGDDTTLLTGHIASGPFTELACDGVAVTHGAASGTVYTARVYGKLEGYPEADSGPYVVPNPELDETGKASLSARGKYLRMQLTVAGDTAWSAGPLWIEANVEAGADG